MREYASMPTARGKNTASIIRPMMHRFARSSPGGDCVENSHIVQTYLGERMVRDTYAKCATLGSPGPRKFGYRFPCNRPMRPAPT